MSFFDKLASSLERHADEAVSRLNTDDMPYEYLIHVREHHWRRRVLMILYPIALIGNLAKIAFFKPRFFYFGRYSNYISAYRRAEFKYLMITLFEVLIAISTLVLLLLGNNNPLFYWGAGCLFLVQAAIYYGVLNMLQETEHAVFFDCLEAQAIGYRDRGVMPDGSETPPPPRELMSGEYDDKILVRNYLHQYIAPPSYNPTLDD